MCRSLVYHILQPYDFMLVNSVLQTLDTMHIRSAESVSKAGFRGIAVFACTNVTESSAHVCFLCCM